MLVDEGKNQYVTTRTVSRDASVHMEWSGETVSSHITSSIGARKL